MCPLGERYEAARSDSPTVNQVWFPQIEYVATLLHGQGFEVSIPEEGVEVKIPDASAIFDALIMSKIGSHATALFHGPPELTEEETFQIWVATSQASIRSEVLDSPAEKAGEILYFLHFYFLFLDLFGLQSYTNSWILTHARSLTKLVLERDLLADASLVSHVSPDVFTIPAGEWMARVKKFGVVDGDRYLGLARIGFSIVLDDFMAKVCDDFRYYALVQLFFKILWKREPESEEVEEYRTLVNLLGLGMDSMLDSILRFLLGYLGCRRDGSCHCSLDVMPRWSGVRLPETSAYAAYLPVFLDMLDKCVKDGTVTCDGEARTAFEGATLDNIEARLLAFYETLACPAQEFFEACRQEITAICSVQLRAAFDVVAGGGLSDDGICQMIVLASDISDENVKSRVISIISKLCNLVAFCHSRDGLCSGIAELDFCMLKQLNLKFFATKGRAFSLLARTLPMKREVSAHVCELSKLLTESITGIDVTRKVCPELFNLTFFRFVNICALFSSFHIKKHFLRRECTMTEEGLFEVCEYFNIEDQNRLDTLNPSLEGVQGVEGMVHDDCEDSISRVVPSEDIATIVLCKLRDLCVPLLQFWLNSEIFAIVSPTSSLKVHSSEEVGVCDPVTGSEPEVSLGREGVALSPKQPVTLKGIASAGKERNAVVSPRCTCRRDVHDQLFSFLEELPRDRTRFVRKTEEEELRGTLEEELVGIGEQFLTELKRCLEMLKVDGAVLEKFMKSLNAYQERIFSRL